MFTQQIYTCGLVQYGLK